MRVMKGKYGSSVTNDYKYASQTRFNNLITCTVVSQPVPEVPRTINSSLGLSRAQLQALRYMPRPTVRPQRAMMRNSRGLAVSWRCLVAEEEALRKSSSRQL